MSINPQRSLASLTERAEFFRLDVTRKLNAGRRIEWGPFLTIPAVAHFMASLFQTPREQVRLLDAGAGVGTLSAALVAKVCRRESIVADAAVSNQLVPSGMYILAKRFSAKEEPRRIVAAIYDPERISASCVGFENHLNYFHKTGKGLNENLAKGLAVFLNASLVDAYFRQFNGHTQVNAPDLRSLKYPTRSELEALGESVGNRFPDRESLDYLINTKLLNMSTNLSDPTQGRRNLTRQRTSSKS